MYQFYNIGIIGRLEIFQVLDTVKLLIEVLLKKGLNVILEETIANALLRDDLVISSRNLLGTLCDIVIVVGGDGSLLGAARILAQYKVPVLGINRGSLGFLTDISPDDLEKQVSQILEGKYLMENRFLLQSTVERKGSIIIQGNALNDVVLHHGKSTRIVNFELYINEQRVCSQKSDGLIVATPTGSTAYALSAGGPIIYPDVDGIVIVPMYPHTLSSRPIVVGSTSILRILVGKNIEASASQVSCDGQTHFTCSPGDTLTIKRSEKKLLLMHPLGHNYYEIYRKKLGWGE